MGDAIDNYIEKYNYILVKTRRITTSCQLTEWEFIELIRLMCEILVLLDYDMDSFYERRYIIKLYKIKNKA